MYPSLKVPLRTFVCPLMDIKLIANFQGGIPNDLGPGSQVLDPALIFFIE
jgi:hypothetical protein